MQGHQAPEHYAHRLSVTQPTWKEHTMQHTQSIPTCPGCGARVYRTHTCRRSGLVGLSLPERQTDTPTAPPLQLVPMPEGWKAQALAQMHTDQELLDAVWPSRAQLHLVEDPDLDWSGDQ